LIFRKIFILLRKFKKFVYNFKNINNNLNFYIDSNRSSQGLSQSIRFIAVLPTSRDTNDFLNLILKNFNQKNKVN